jgi:hypothetical protein
MRSESILVSRALLLRLLLSNLRRTDDKPAVGDWCYASGNQFTASIFGASALACDRIGFVLLVKLGEPLLQCYFLIANPLRDRAWLAV